MTLTPDMTLGSLVTQDIGRSRVLERLGLDYCCGGHRTLAEAAGEAGLEPDEVIQALSDSPTEEGVDCEAMSLTELTRHLVGVHHAYLWQEMPRLSALVAKVSGVHGERHPELSDIQKVYEELRAELEPHLTKEERILFPAIEQLDAGGSPGVAPAGPIRMMMAEHDAAGELLNRLRDLTGGYVTPDDGCQSYEAMTAGLADLEHDTHVHIHKENNILFPRVLAQVA